MIAFYANNLFDLVEIRMLLIGKKKIRAPYFIQHRWVESDGVLFIVGKSKSRIIPTTSQKYVESVVLR